MLKVGKKETEAVSIDCQKFKNKDFRVLIATDIAARGLDVNKLACVVNYALPRSPMDYIHRIGRTGRAGQSGLAISFIDHEDKAHFKLIEKRAGISLLREQIPGFELQDAPEQIKKAPVKGKRKSKKDRLREMNKNTKYAQGTISPRRVYISRVSVSFL